MDIADNPEKMGNVMELTMGQKFELEKMNRAIDSCSSIDELRSLAKTLTSAWMTQKAAIAWMIRQQIESDQFNRKQAQNE